MQERESNNQILHFDDEQDGSDWEYEYSETETEQFYVTVDLTTHGPSRSRERISRPSDIVSKTSTQQTTASGNVLTEHGLLIAETVQETNDTPPENSPKAADVHHESQQACIPDIDHDRIQILDIGSSNPLIVYRDQLYSCHWASAVGTDLLFTAKTTTGPTSSSISYVSAEQSSHIKPIHSTPKYNLIAATPLRLVAKPAQLRPRPVPSNPPVEPVEPLLDTSASHQHTSSATVSTPPPVLFETLSATKAQNVFMQRLRAIKSNHGDTDMASGNTNIRGAGRRPRKPISPMKDVTADTLIGPSSAPNFPPTVGSAQHTSSAKSTGPLLGEGILPAAISSSTSMAPPTVSISNIEHPSSFETAGVENQSAQCPLTPSVNTIVSEGFRVPSAPASAQRQILPHTSTRGRIIRTRGARRRTQPGMARRSGPYSLYEGGRGSRLPGSATNIDGDATMSGVDEDVSADNSSVMAVTPSMSNERDANATTSEQMG